MGGSGEESARLRDNPSDSLVPVGQIDCTPFHLGPPNTYREA